MENKITEIILVAFGIIVPIVGIFGYRAISGYDEKLKILFSKTDKIDVIETNQRWIIKLGGFDIPKGKDSS